MFSAVSHSGLAFLAAAPGRACLALATTAALMAAWIGLPRLAQVAVALHKSGQNDEGEDWLSYGPADEDRGRGGQD
ncbi:hypothetical protein [Pseudoroseicyclus aestuarii]|uniref:Uncharacterized protein n=1 Tax=Pseudoroseicyclus aestuarii TaxID=1795041 RepID=A0A318SWV3_9RHOB|nr:hypothetical protein [Pseudoroseicyclus aestuarii]PYE85943.1 hypothetical protein DFP88_101617 [Pseudoroseicyclus aestuarii]